jgi:hypothetical protein
MVAVNRQAVELQFLIRSWEQVGPSTLRRAQSLYLDAQEEELELKESGFGPLPLLITLVHSITRQKPSARCFCGRNHEDSKSIPKPELQYVT